jgi:hypothetical protein
MHGIALCMKSAEVAMNGRRVITALGKDRDAIRAADRDTPLFDLGLGLSTVDFCVRPGDAETLRALEDAEGTPLLDNPALFARLQAASPHRVLVSRVGRIEVLGSIPPPDRHSPEGPHTHLLPICCAPAGASPRRSQSRNAGHPRSSFIYPTRSTTQKASVGLSITRAMRASRTCWSATVTVRSWARSAGSSRRFGKGPSRMANSLPGPGTSALLRGSPCVNL